MDISVSRMAIGVLTTAGGHASHCHVKVFIDLAFPVTGYEVVVGVGHIQEGFIALPELIAHKLGVREVDDIPAVVGIVVRLWEKHPREQDGKVQRASVRTFARRLLSVIFRSIFL